MSLRLVAPRSKQVSSDLPVVETNDGIFVFPDNDLTEPVPGERADPETAEVLNLMDKNTTLVSNINLIRGQVFNGYAGGGEREPIPDGDLRQFSSLLVHHQNLITPLAMSVFLFLCRTKSEVESAYFWRTFFRKYIPQFINNEMIRLVLDHHLRELNLDMVMNAINEAMNVENIPRASQETPHRPDLATLKTKNKELSEEFKLFYMADAIYTKAGRGFSIPNMEVGVGTLEQRRWQEFFDRYNREIPDRQIMGQERSPEEKFGSKLFWKAFMMVKFVQDRETTFHDYFFDALPQDAFNNSIEKIRQNFNSVKEELSGKTPSACTIQSKFLV